ncbi:MAG: ATP-binding protein [Xanthomonadales bacterium]|nr:ATP-binding protein [Xanthomonadales bacterium]
MLLLDRGGRILYANHAAGRALGSGAARLPGTELAAHRALDSTLAGPLRQVLADRRERQVHECLLPGGLYDVGLQPVGDNGVLVELLDQRWARQRQELQQSEVQTGLMALLRRNLGHEIRNPLGGIRGAAQMLAGELNGTEQGDLARLIMREVDRIDELLNRFGQPRLERGTVQLHQLMDEAAALLASEAGGELQIEQDYDPSIPPLDGDAGALRQVLLNVLRNAWQADAGHIRLRTRIEHGVALRGPEPRTAVRVDVDDDGSGVPEHLRALLFLPLVSGRRDGTGLGLALSQQIAAAHGGLLGYEPLETGSRFTLRLPLGPRGDADD